MSVDNVRDKAKYWLPWKVTLYNQHAQSAIAGYGISRKSAFDAAMRRAGPLLHYGFTRSSPEEQDEAWANAFKAAMAWMGRGKTMTSHSSPHGFCVEIRKQGRV